MLKSVTIDGKQEHPVTANTSHGLVNPASLPDALSLTNKDTTGAT